MASMIYFLMVSLINISNLTHLIAIQRNTITASANWISCNAMINSKNSGVMAAQFLDQKISVQ